MNDTPNQTAERVIAEAMVNAGAPLMHSRVEESVAAALRANGLLSEGAPSEQQVELAAEALARREPMRSATEWENLHEFERSGFRESARAALVAAGVAPQAESADHEKLIARLTGSVNALSVTCGECGSKPGNRCYGGGEMRRWHASRGAKAERALRIEAADALAALVLPSSGVDEDKLANLIHSTSVAHFGGLDPRVAPIIARAVAEFLKP